MNKQDVATRLSAVLQTRVDVGLHRRIEDVYEERVTVQRDLLGHDRKVVTELDGVPLLKPYLDVRPVFSTREDRVRVLVAQNVVDLGERFTFVDDKGVERDVDPAVVAEAEAWCRANPPPPREPAESEVVAEALRAKITAAELEAARGRLKRR